jgi:hypothetical protein
LVPIGERSGLKVKAPSEGALHGAFVGTEDNAPSPADVLSRMRDFEQTVRSEVQVVSLQSNWHDGIQFPLAAARAIFENGQIPLVQIFPVSDQEPNIDGRDPGYDLRKIAQGDFDTGLTRMLRSIATLKRSDGQRVPVIIVFGPEANDQWYRYSGIHYGGGQTAQWGADDYPDGPEIFRDAYRHLIELARTPQVNASNITWAMHFDLQGTPRESWNLMEYYYPGDEYIDWIGFSALGARSLDELQWYDSLQDVFESYSAGYENRWAEFVNVSAQADKGMFEYAVIEDPDVADRKANWLKNALQTVMSEYPEIKLVNYWHENAWLGQRAANFEVDTSASALQAYREMIEQPFFQAKFVIDDYSADGGAQPEPEPEPQPQPAEFPELGTVLDCNSTLTSVSGGEQVSAVFKGERSYAVFWLNGAGEKVHLGQVTPSKPLPVRTYVGHVFYVGTADQCYGLLQMGQRNNEFTVRGTAYYPRCAVRGLYSEGFQLAYSHYNARWGYMRLVRGHGFSCKNKAGAGGDNLYPVCAEACPVESQPVGDWGWCDQVEGFTCRR